MGGSPALPDLVHNSLFQLHFWLPQLAFRIERIKSICIRLLCQGTLSVPLTGCAILPPHPTPANTNLCVLWRTYPLCRPVRPTVCPSFSDHPFRHSVRPRAGFPGTSFKPLTRTPCGRHSVRPRSGGPWHERLAPNPHPLASLLSLAHERSVVFGGVEPLSAALASLPHSVWCGSP